MRVKNFKRIVKEDYPAEAQEVISKLGASINPFADQVMQAFDGNIDFDNLNQEVVFFDVEVDTNGVPKTQIEIKSNLKTKVRGYNIIRIDMINHNTFPSGMPLIFFRASSDIVVIEYIKGLPANKRYRITAIAIG